MTFVHLGDGAAPAGLGGKGTSWFRLHALGVPVPDGFVILPGEAAREASLRAAIDALVARSGCSALAVRSSGAAEDGADRSLAGLFTSELDVAVEPKALFHAVERCRRAGRSARVRAALGREEEPAVLVQEMLSPVWSGVLFTRDPRSGEATPVLELVRGHLRGLVDGAPADIRATLDGEGRTAIEAAIGRSALERLLALADAAERVTGGPADIEWAITPRGVVLLQARPITSAPEPVVQRGIELVPVDRAHRARLPRAVREHDKVTLRLLADALDIPMSRGLVALCRDVRDEEVTQLASTLAGWGELIAVLLSPFHWEGKILRKLGSGATALTDLQGFFHALRSRNEWFAFLLKELQPTARTAVVARLRDGHVRAEIIHGHFVTKGIADATSYLLAPDGEIVSVRMGSQTRMVHVDRGARRIVPVETPPELSSSERHELCDVLRKLSPHHPDAGVEVGYTPSGELFLVDLYEGSSVAPTSTSHDVLSEGRILGRVRYLDLDERALEESIERHVHDARESPNGTPDEPEILVVERPYHLLDRLVYAATPGTLGIVCEEGSLLCHLAVVMREKAIPGLLLPGARSLIGDGDQALLDTRPGSRTKLRKV